MIARLATLAILALASSGCAQTFLQLRCEPAVEFAGAAVTVDGSGDTVASADALVCGIPVGISSAFVEGTVTLCLAPPSGAPICTVVE